MLEYITNFYKKKSIKQKILLVFSVQIIIPMTFMGIMFYKNTQKVIQNNSISYATDVIKMIELRMNDFYNNLINVTEEIICDEKLYVGIDAGQDDETKKESKDYVYNELRRICIANEDIHSITITTTSEHIYGYHLNSGNTISEQMENKDLLDSMLRQARTEKDKAAWYTQLDDSGKIKDLYLIRMIYGNDDFKEKGLIVIQINRGNIEKIYTGLSAKFAQNINILNKDNKWITGTNPDWNIKDDNYWLINEKNNLAYSIDKKHQKLSVFINEEESEWKIIAEGSLNELVNNEMEQFRFLFTVITICTITLVSVFSVLMAIDIIKPINSLIESIKKVEQENIHQEVVVDREDELGYLSSCFNKMSKQIDNLLNRVYKEEITRREAELKALQAQINPHFLFNTLESISWMAEFNQVSQVRAMVTSLGALLEASIGKGNPMVQLSKELKYVDNYLLIMKNRYEDRLTYESDIDKTLLNQEVPKLILQPLIENAIYHGIDKMRKNGIIKLTIKKEDCNICIEVMDNGKGIPKNEVEILNKKFKDNNDDYVFRENHKSIGLVNVNGRVKLFFGKEYGLEIDSEYEVCTKIKLNIPIRS